MNRIGRMLSSAAVALMIAMASLAQGAEDTHKFETPAQKALYEQLADELRCPKCQNQNIADSNASVAKDLRNKVYKLVMEGQTKQQVIDFMVERYGYFVYYKPPVTPATLILWLLPLGFAFFTFFLIWFKAKKSQRGLEKSEWTAQQEQQLMALIATIESGFEPAKSTPQGDH